MSATPAPSDRASGPAVSVCMATYNGEKYIEAQLDSIFSQLHDDDELVIIDDSSSDSTMEILERINDPRLVLHRNRVNLGYVGTFERAMRIATKDVLLLSDQDDIWIEGRRDSLTAATADAEVVASDLLVLGSNEPLRSPLTGRPWLLSRDDTSRLRNELLMLMGNAPYFGCAMAIRRDALDLILPFPSYLHESHDLWIATVGNAAGTMRHVHKPSILRRIHDDNASPSKPRSIVKAVRSRFLLLRLWRQARARINRSS